MKILILPSWYLPDGGYFIKEQALFLQETGLKVDVLVNRAISLTKHTQEFFYRSFSLDCHNEDGLNTYRCYTRKLPKFERLNIRRWAYRTIAAYEEYQKKEGAPDLIHVHSATWGGYAASLIKEKYGIPYIITEHRGILAMQSTLANNLLKPWYDTYFSKAYGMADYIVPVSDQLMKKIGQITVPDGKWRAIPNIVDTQFFYPNKNKSKRFRFVCVNGYYKVKAYDILLNAFDIFCETNNDAEIYIAGENFEHQEFQQLLKRCKNKERINFAGELDRKGVRQLLWTADVFLLPSRVESQSIAVLEALSCGVPVLCTDVVPEFVMPSPNGIRVPNENPVAFANGMKAIYENCGNYDRNQISEFVKTIASKEVVIEKILQVYREVLEGNGSLTQR